MANRVGSARTTSSSGRVTRAKLRRTAVVAVDGALALSAGALAGLFGTGPAAAQAPTPGWSGVQAPLPTAPDGVGTNALANISNESCISAVSCAAVGSYDDGAGHTHGVLEVLGAGSWTASEAPVPANADATRESDLSGVSCATSTWCEAVGDYTDSAGGSDAMVETYTGGAWTAVEAPVPGDALTGASADSFLKSIACQSAQNCTAIGQYETAAGSVGLIDTLVGGTWSTQAAPQPAGAGAAQQVNLAALSCPSTGACAASGIYSTGSATVPELLVQAGPGGAWTAQDAPVPADAVTGAGAEGEVLSVSCSAGICEGSGQYVATGGLEKGLLERLAGGCLDGDRGATAGERRNRVECAGVTRGGVVRARWLHGRRRLSGRQRRRARARGGGEQHGSGLGRGGTPARRRVGHVERQSGCGVVPVRHRLRCGRSVPERHIEQSGRPARFAARHHLDPDRRRRSGERGHGRERRVGRHDGVVLEPRGLWGRRALHRRRRSATGPVGRLHPGAGLLVGCVRRRHLQLRAHLVLPGLHGRAASERAHGGHGGHPGGRGLLGGGDRRRHLQLRQRGLPRFDREPAPQQADRGNGDHARRGGLLAGGLRRRHLQLRRRQLLRLGRIDPPQQAHRRHGGHAGRPRLLAGGQ